MDSNFAHISPMALQGSLLSGEDFILIDLRSTDKFDFEHIPNAISLPQKDLCKDFLSLLGVSAKKFSQASVCLICETGEVSEQIAKSEKALTAKHLFVLKGGTSAWQKFGLPLRASRMRNAA